MGSLKELFDKSRLLWGLESQMLMLVEELNELGVAALHLLRTNRPKIECENHFAEEIADVEFMLAEMKHYFKNTEDIAYYREKKEKRLRQMLAVCCKVQRKKPK